jgi:SAM-dependent methyltransferase
VREQRLVFGEVADLYDRFRPTYPDPLIDELIAVCGLDGSSPALEVGAGTGKATVMFAARGIAVLGIEPNAEMARVARRNCSAYPDVEIEESDFERWDPRGRHFPLVFSAQAWHWVDPGVGYPKARDVLLPEGCLGAFWNRFAWEKSELRDRLLDAYRRAAPELRSAGGMHPANLTPYRDADWEAEIAAVEGLGDPEVRNFEWDRTYSTGEYVGLLATASDVRMLDEPTRARLLAAVAAVIEARGGVLSIRMRTRLCLARRN